MMIARPLAPAATTGTNVAEIQQAADILKHDAFAAMAFSAHPAPAAIAPVTVGVSTTSTAGVSTTSTSQSLILESPLDKLLHCDEHSSPPLLVALSP